MFPIIYDMACWSFAINIWEFVAPPYMIGHNGGGLYHSPMLMANRSLIGNRHERFVAWFRRFSTSSVFL